MKAIETLYGGYRFRSRLEARWAVFFNTLNLWFEYEKEGYDLDGLRYLPDFWLPVQRCWIEVKGQEASDEEYHKAELLALYTRHPVFIFSNDIWYTQAALGVHCVYHSEQAHFRYGGASGYQWFECTNCHYLDVTHLDEGSECPQCRVWYNPEEKAVLTKTPLLVTAYEAARQARFE